MLEWAYPPLTEELSILKHICVGFFFIFFGMNLWGEEQALVQNEKQNIMEGIQQVIVLIGEHQKKRKKKEKKRKVNKTKWNEMKNKEYKSKLV